MVTLVTSVPLTAGFNISALNNIVALYIVFFVHIIFVHRNEPQVLH